VYQSDITNVDQLNMSAHSVPIWHYKCGSTKYVGL